MKLRPYQSKLIADTRALFRQGKRAPLLVSPCGSGKTVLFSYMAGQSAGRVVILAHREELLGQISRTLGMFDVPHSWIAAGREYSASPRVAVASVQTLAKRLGRVQAPSLVIIDEAHHATSASYRQVLSAWPGALVVGVTASPERLDGTGLGDVFDSMALGPTVTELTELGALCPYRIYAPSRPDLTAVATRAGDYARDALAVAMDKPTITGCAVSHYQRLAAGKRAVVFCVSVQHSRDVAMQFQAAGFQSAWLDGGMDGRERDRTVAKFRTGAIQVLTSCDLISEGFDLPAIEVAIMLRPTQSTALWIQQSGRALRPHEGKDYAIILDHAGNVFRHGLPDAPREWTLEGRKRGRRNASEQEVHIRTCPSCMGAQPRTGATVCRYCGALFPIDPRQVDEVAGELAEVEREQARVAARQEVGRAKTLAELVDIGTKRGYKNPYHWARHILAARARR